MWTSLQHRLRQGVKALASTLCCLFLLSPAAWAHLMPAQQGTLNLLDKAVFVAVALPVSALSGVDDNADGRLSELELQTHAPGIKAQIAQRFRLWDGDQPAQADFLQVMTEPDERTLVPNVASGAGSAGAPYFLVLMKAGFAAAPQALRLEIDLFGKEAKERQLALKATRGLDTEAVVLTPLHTGHRFFRSPWQVFQDYGVLGVEHILMGADHLLFLLTLIVAAAGWRYWLGVLTSFTVAHSITLTMSLLGWLHAPAAVVEPLIAASIVLMALLNLWQPAAVPRQRMAIVFACGLLHGMGFASSMADMGLHGAYRVTSVLGFNLGIELGQALFLGLVLIVGRGVPALKRLPWLRHVEARLPLARLASAMALVVGGFWFLERLGSITAFGVIAGL